MKSTPFKLNRKFFLILGGVLLIAAALFVFFFVKPEKEKTPPPPPDEYSISNLTMAALPSEEGVSVSKDTPEDSGEVIYQYTGFTAAGDVVADYTQKLTKEYGFTVVDDGYYEMDLPDFTTEEGLVTLAKPDTSEGNLLSIQLSWFGEDCTVVLSNPAGSIQKPMGMTLLETLDYFRALPPSTLGLPGTSMKEYRVYALDGTVLVDRRPCLQLNVYTNTNQEETNEIQGMYLMTSDGQHLYRLDKESKTVTPLNH